MNFSISPVRLPWDHYAVKSVTYFYVVLKIDMNLMIRKGHFNFPIKFRNCGVNLLFMKGDGVIALETGFVYLQSWGTSGTNYFFSCPDNVQLHFLW